MKTCLLIPVKDRANILPILLKAIDALDPQPDKIIFLENNSIDNTLRILKDYCQIKPLQRQLIALWLKDGASSKLDPYTVIAQVRDILLQAACNFNADYAIFLDSDVVPLSTDMITLLCKWEKDIVGCSYMQDSQIIIDKGRDMVYRCEIVGTQCLALSRMALHHLRFYPLLQNDDDINFCREDYGFSIKARELAFKLWWYPNVRLKLVEDKKSAIGKRLLSHHFLCPNLYQHFK